MKSMSCGILVLGSPALPKCEISTPQPNVWTLSCCLRFVAEVVAAGEDDVGVADEPGLVLDERLGGAGELRELVHAVVDHAAVGEVPQRPGGVHRAVVPQERAVERSLVVVHPLDRLAGPLAEHRRQLGVLVPRHRDVRADDRDVRHHAVELEVRVRALGAVEERLLDEQDRVPLGEPREELLRALPDEAPAQMAEDHDAVTVGGLVVDDLHRRAPCACSAAAWAAGALDAEARRGVGDAAARPARRRRCGRFRCHSRSRWTCPPRSGGRGRASATSVGWIHSPIGGSCSSSASREG